jgi:two-component system OmpR family response regulator
LLALRPAVAVLLVHHDPAEALIVAEALNSAGLRATVHPATQSLVRLDAAPFDVIVVGAAGDVHHRLSLCRRLRLDGYKGAILAIARDTTEVHPYVEAGADDFAAAPIQATEVVARVRVALRRVASRNLRWGPLEIDRDERTVTLRGRKLALTAREYSLLTCLTEGAGNTVSRSELVHRVWRHDPGSNMVEVHLSRLRDKLGDDASLIETVRRSGYRLRR